MKHQAFEELRRYATVDPDMPYFGTREQRLARWAELLEREPTRRLSMLHRLEFASRADREACRSDDSPLAVAFADPLLRASGLTGDTYGEACAFFGLSAKQGHHLLCACHNGASAEARSVARNVRTLASPPRNRLVAALKAWLSPLL